MILLLRLIYINNFPNISDDFMNDIPKNRKVIKNYQQKLI